MLFQSGALRSRSAAQSEWYQQALGRDNLRNPLFDSCSLFQLRISVLHPLALERVEFALTANQHLGFPPFVHPESGPRTET
jgi:hypothetical protein